MLDPGGNANIFYDLASLLGIILIVVPSTITMFLQSIFYLKGRSYRRAQEIEYIKSPCKLSIIIPIRKEPRELLEEALSYIYEAKNKLVCNSEVVIVSDDPRERLGEIKDIVNKWLDKLEIHFMWRAIPRGYRTGALNDALHISNGDYVYVMDVDSRFHPDSINKAIEILRRSKLYDANIVAAVIRWRASNRDTRLSEALASSMDYIVDSIYRGRTAFNLPVLPTGTGTVFDGYFLKHVLKGWDEKRIQDDMEIGSRIISLGKKIVFIDDPPIYVEVPRRIKSFRIQQERWAYGATDVAITRFKHIVKSPQPLYSKIELLAFLLQYMPVFLMIIGILLIVIGLFNEVDAFGKYWYIGIPWIGFMALYGYTYVDSQVRRGSSIWRAIVNLGRIAAATDAISLIIAKSVLKALLRIPLVYKRTPKRKHEVKEKSLRIPYEIIFSLMLTIIAIYGLVKGMIYTSSWILFYTLGYYYSIIRWGEDFLYN